jgi:hypothetical protein
MRNSARKIKLERKEKWRHQEVCKELEDDENFRILFLSDGNMKSMNDEEKKDNRLSDKDDESKIF